jgi:hypothetical protein
VTFLLDHDVPHDIEYSLAALGHSVLKLREVLPRPRQMKRCCALPLNVTASLSVDEKTLHDKSAFPIRVPSSIRVGCFSPPSANAGLSIHDQPRKLPQSKYV